MLCGETHFKNLIHQTNEQCDRYVINNRLTISPILATNNHKIQCGTHSPSFPTSSQRSILLHIRYEHTIYLSPQL